MAQWSRRGASALALLAVGCMPRGTSIEVLRGSLREREEHAKVEALIARSANISANLTGLSHEASLDAVTRHLLASLRVCGGCSHFKRLGEATDGGYLTCMDGWEHGGVKAAYSMGVEHHDKWSEDMSFLLHGGTAGTVVHQFDCTVAYGQPCPGCQFHRVCIAAENAPAQANYWSLSQVLSNTGLAQTPDRSLIMKMDIEAAEWPILASERPDVLRKFRQVILEFHWLEKRYNHQQYDQAVTALLNAGFSVVHIHGNNWAGMYYVPNSPYSVPNVLEVTFVADAPPKQCESRQTLHPLDADNNYAGASLPMANLPTSA